MMSFPEHGQFKGLSESEAADRLQQDGYNELTGRQQRNFLTLALDIVQEPIFLLLVACGTIYWILGDAQEALILLGFVFLIVGINLYQEQKTERSLEALRDLSSPRALVIREGVRRRIAGREVVVGDLIVLSEGDLVPADAVLVWSTYFNVNEALLTGESVPVRKRSAQVTSQAQLAELAMQQRPGGDDLPCVYSGTRLVQGQGVAQCYSAGIRVVMITGDYPVTAQNIARQIGLLPIDRVMTGTELEQMSAAELRDRIQTTNIFARVVPEQKLLIVNEYSLV